MKKTIAINDNWLFTKGFSPAYPEGDFEGADFYLANLPHNAPPAASGEAAVYTYSRVLIVPERYNGSRLILCFGGITGYAEVYVNGVFAASHRGDTPFTADITAPVRYEYENRIVVKVDASPRDDVPYRAGPIYGGLYRDVSLRIVDGRAVRDAHVYTPTVGPISRVAMDVSLYDYYPDTQLSADILTEDGTVAGTLSAKSVQGATVSLRGEVEDARLWDPTDPVRYTARIRLTAGQKLLDEHCVSFGFVRAVFRRDGFFLNGRPVKLTGLVREDGYPTLGRAVPAMQQRADARFLCNVLGCNAVRTMGLASSDFIDECSRIGLMVIADVGGRGATGGTEWRDALIADVTAAVLRDRNEPCVIAWGVRPDDASDCDELYFKTGKAAREADGQRATFGARNFIGSHLYEDVFGYHEAGAGWPVRRLQTGKWFAPYLIAAHTGRQLPVKSWDPEGMRLEQALRHLSVMDRVRTSGRICGAFGTGMSDGAAAPQAGSGDGRCYEGVSDAFRHVKLSGYAYASQGDEPVLALSSDLSPDEFVGQLYVFTNADSVRLYRDDVQVGEFFPAFKQFPGLKHPPVVIDDFVGDLPAREASGLALWLLKRVLWHTRDTSVLRLTGPAKAEALVLKKLLKLDTDGLAALLDRYATVPAGGVTYRFEGVFGGEVRLTRTLGKSSVQTLRVACDARVVHCTKSYEVVRFSLTAEDAFGNRLPYDFTPVTVRAAGSVALVGPSQIGLQGGVGGFYVKTISQGQGVVTVTSDRSEQVIQLEVEYDETMERI